jgi:glucose-6-phosphate 1-dehydrogenase
LFGLYKDGLLPKGVHIVGYARTKMTDDEYHQRTTQYIKADDDATKKKVEEFKAASSYIAGAYDKPEAFQVLHKHLVKIESSYEGPARNRIFYMALPPSVFTEVAKGLKQNCYLEGATHRVVVEKPFGKDLESAREMMGALKSQWSEDETFRIDHYLGKDMVKNLLVLRFANVVLNSAWDKNAISNIQITFKEPFGTEGRGGYFDEFGIIRDILQNREIFLTFIGICPLTA